MLPAQSPSITNNYESRYRVDFPTQQTLAARFEHQASETPNRIAVQGRQHNLTYRALDNRANQLANHLIDLGLTPGTLVTLYLDRSIETIVAILALFKAGCAYVPVATDQPQQRTGYILNDTASPLILTQRHHEPTLCSLNTGLVFVDDTSIYENTTTDKPQVTTQPTDLAYVIYTSGTTGNPKGVMLSHRAVVNRLHWMQSQYPLDVNDTVLFKTPYTFDVSVWEILWANQTGAKIVVAGEGEHRNPEALYRLAERFMVTVMHFVPSMLSAYLQAGQPLPTSLKRTFCSGEALTAGQVAHYFESATEQQALTNLYGPTEAAIDVTYYDCTGQDGKVIPIGKPIQNISLTVADEQLNPVEPGETGELLISGAGLAQGYLNRPQLSDEKFIDRQGIKYYRTGDLVRLLPDGNLEYLGRNDFQIKINGLRIEPGEIEHQLEQLDEIAQATVIALKRHGSQYLAAYLIPTDGHEPSTDKLAEALAQHLPAHMVPAAFVSLSAFPTTANGKLDRKALPEPVFVEQTDYRAPQNEVQTQLCELFAELLRVNSVGIDDNFFNLGGQSITAIKLSAECHRRYGFELPYPLLFEHKTIARITANLNQSGGEVIGKHPGKYAPVSFSQQSLLFIEQLEQGFDAYHLPFLTQLDPHADIHELQNALNRVLAKHQGLRTLYLSDGDGYNYQQICDQSLTITRHEINGRTTQAGRA